MFATLSKKSASNAPSHYQNDYVTDRLNAQRILALISLLIPTTLLLLFLIMPTASDLNSNPLVTIISLVVIAQAAVRLFVNWRKILNDNYQIFCACVDFASLAFILLAYADTYNVPVSVALKSPTANIFFIYLASRVILFNRTILLKTGFIAMVTWACLVGLALMDPLFEGRTSSFTEYMTSFKVLLGAELERGLQFGLMTAILYVFLQSIRIDPPTGFVRRVFFMGSVSRFLLSAKSRVSHKNFALIEIRGKNISGLDEVFNAAFSFIPHLPILKRVKVAKIGKLSDQSVAISIEYSKADLDLAEALALLQSELKTKCVETLSNNAPTLIVAGCKLNPDLSINKHLIYTDAAIREAIASGKSSVVFDEGLLAQIEHKQTLEKAIKTGLETKSFSVVYQPIIDLMTESPIGFEALIRLRDQNDKAISPVIFIPVAEATGLIDDVTDTLCDQIAKEAPEIYEMYKGHAVQPYINVNISPSQLKDVNRILAALKRAEQGGVKINIEITESTICDDDVAEDALSRLREAGFLIAIDDFGTGYSSLQRLETLKVATLKIDQCFVRNIGNAGAHDFLSAIVSLARATAQNTIVEGVETFEQKVLLMKMGVRYCQGYHWARPADIRLLGKYLSDEHGFRKPQTRRFGHMSLI